MSAIFSTTQELITEIVQMTKEVKPWLIVEGDSDIRFFEQRFNSQNPITYEERNGWKGVVDLLTEWHLLSDIEKKGKTVIGVIDRDYHEAIKTVLPKDIVTVDHRDLEIVMFESDEALNKVLLELGSKEKIPRINGQFDLQQVRQVIYDLAYPLSKLRFLNALTTDINLKFSKPFNFKKVIELNPLCLKHDKLIERISIDSCCHVDQVLQLMADDIGEEWDVHTKIANGHDVISILGKSLQKHFGNVSDSKFVEGERLESIFRMAYPNQEFENSNFGKKLMMLLGFIKQSDQKAA
ncbi:DUF4435 domain-containing protein [Acinetobacter baumannii]|uniref:DUF4435 domain-containing protein n=1 Tax=Bacteria TaxID=2 RepID=UPI0002BA9E89|nr:MULTISPECIES: DUF4435 domain-containing protein [Bacteria]ANS20671.1 hypothetical protein G424_04855 [Acinetobacter baumannii PR07]KAB0457228.1 DUF4435 domain-containing protein [Acinetobacter baumannii]MBF9225903.1 DUF4435 domain-containing protein [Acinetobacter baumannii]MBI1410706.1 DUF4435 domain-containing protein [Acinetobacter baumannii]MBI1430399.1 DUF4435 domain-containing protein [Acinetobacter baumannii]